MSRVATKIISPVALRAKHVGYVLPNGVRCVIVQDPNAKVPAAAMSIAAGQLNDPPALPGLAHFCEHMLFMGTEKFPKEDEYDSFISKNNGSNNAFTADCATVYYFNVSDTALEGALEHFVEFFVAPTFNESAVNREVQAVHSEDEKNHSVDYWRTDELNRVLFNDHHPRSRYGNGNQTTLVDEPKQKGINLREELKQFYAASYAAEGACIAIYSARDPEEVMKLVEAPLLRMKPGKGPSFHFVPEGESLFKAEALGLWMNVRTVKKKRSISVRWPVKSAAALWKSMPGAYISHILGHECDSSVLGVLKKRDWATAMYAGGSRLDDDYEIFSFTIDLTLEGFRHVSEVVALVYEYIGLAVNNGINEAVYAQMKAEDRLSFESTEVSNAASHCVALAQSVAESDLAHCLIGGACILEDNLEATLAYAKQLTPENAETILLWGSLPTTGAATTDAAKEAAEKGEQQQADDEEEEADEEEEEEEGDASPEKLFSSLPDFAQKPADALGRFHKAQYAKTRVPDAQLAAWRAALEKPTCVDLQLPAVNPFIADDFTIFPNSAEKAVPETISTPHGTTIIRKDAHHHNAFKCSVQWAPISPVAYATALHRLYTQVMVRILKDSMTELSYYGELASLENELVPDVGGPGFTVTGPYQQLPTFFSKVLATTLALPALRGTAEKYSTHFETYVRSMEGRASNQPYEHAVERLNKLVCSVNYTFEDILAAAPSASYEGYCAFAESFLRSGLLFECFIAGNMPSAQAMADSIIATVEQRLTDAGVPVPEKSAITRFRDALDLSAPLAAGTVSAKQPTQPVLSSLNVVSLPSFNTEDPNVCTLLSICVGELSAQNAALCSVAAKVFSSLFFNALRTKESLGYIVFAQHRPVLATSNLVFCAQSAVAEVDGLYLLSRIVAFLAGLEEKLEALCSAGEIENIKSGLIQALEKLPDSVAIDAARLKVDYLSPLGLDNRGARIKALKEDVTPTTLLEFFKRYVLNDRTETRALALVLNSSRTKVGADAFASSVGKTSVVSLPTQRKVAEEMKEGDKAAPHAGEGDLSLPTFESASEAAVELTVVSDIAAYRTGRRVIRDKTF